MCVCSSTSVDNTRSHSHVMALDRAHMTTVDLGDTQYTLANTQYPVADTQCPPVDTECPSCNTEHPCPRRKVVKDDFEAIKVGAMRLTPTRVWTDGHGHLQRPYTPTMYPRSRVRNTLVAMTLVVLALVALVAYMVVVYKCPFSASDDNNNTNNSSCVADKDSPCASSSFSNGDGSDDMLCTSTQNTITMYALLLLSIVGPMVMYVTCMFRSSSSST